MNAVPTHEAIKHLARHRPHLVAFAKYLGASHADAQDCAQVALTRAWQHIDDFESCDYDGALRMWLITILKNHFFDRCRRARVHAKYADLIASGSTCECRGEDSYDVEILLRAIDRLSDAQRVAITGYLLGSDYQCIADQLGIPIGTVKSRIARARAALGAA